MIRNDAPPSKVRITCVKPEEWSGRMYVSKLLENDPERIEIVLNRKLGKDDVLDVIAALMADFHESPHLGSNIRPSDINGVKYFTEAQAAELLHRAPATIQRLRLAGDLAFMPGKPALISEKELAAYVTRKTKHHGAPGHELDASHPSGARVVIPPTRKEDPADSAARIIALRQLYGPIKRTRLTEEEKQRRAAEVERQRKSRERKKAAAKAKKAREAGPS